MMYWFMLWSACYGVTHCIRTKTNLQLRIVLLPSTLTTSCEEDGDSDWAACLRCSNGNSITNSQWWEDNYSSLKIYSSIPILNSELLLLQLQNFINKKSHAGERDCLQYRVANVGLCKLVESHTQTSSNIQCIWSTGTHKFCHITMHPWSCRFGEQNSSLQVSWGSVG